MKKIIGYARWKGSMDWSTREVPVFVYDETTWKIENLKMGEFRKGVQKVHGIPDRIHGSYELGRGKGILPSRGRYVGSDDGEREQLRSKVILPRKLSASLYSEKDMDLPELLPTVEGLAPDIQYRQCPSSRLETCSGYQTGSFGQLADDLECRMPASPLSVLSGRRLGNA